MATSPLIELNNGTKIPAIGLGTWKSDPDDVSNAVSYALKSGYRHIDCAWAYVNEKYVGNAIHVSDVPRSEMFITSKVWCTYHSRVEEGLDQTLSELGIDYLDLYLVHWPVPLNPEGNHPVFATVPVGVRDIDPSWKLSDTWKQMEDVLKKGKVKAIGVANFSEAKLAEILPTAEVIPAVNQLELHVYNPQHKLTEYIKSKGILPQASSPLGSVNSPLLTDETVVKIAQKYSLNASDVLIGYLVAKGFSVVPKSVTPSRIASNLTGTLDAVKNLTPADIEELDGLAAAGKQRRFVTPPWPLDLGFENWPPYKT
ncbi:hypothetical protein H0H93_016745 [Arthromyces matolae]|nr:hypothetical protein H0H93_016745 [Arthromyces matolae]